jgi:hypothetical protein
MKIMVTGVGVAGENAVMFDLPNKALSLEGMPRYRDSVGVAFETFIVGNDFDTAGFAEMGYRRVAEEFVREFLEKIGDDIAAVEWRVAPSYEVQRHDKNVWRGSVRCRFTTHKELPT